METYQVPCIKKLRYPLVIIFFAITGFNIYITSQIKRTMKFERVLYAEHPLEKWFDWRQYELNTPLFDQLKFVWGLEPTLILHQDYDRWFSPDTGQLVLENTFRPELPENQQSIYDF